MHELQRSSRNNVVKWRLFLDDMKIEQMMSPHVSSDININNQASVTGSAGFFQGWTETSKTLTHYILGILRLQLNVINGQVCNKINLYNEYEM